jgi:anti-sigma-K factor RskA
MTCDDRKDLLLLYAAGGLEPAEAAALRAHLASGCPACAGALASAEATLGHLPLALDPVPPPRHVRDRLLARIESERGATAPPIRAGTPAGARRLSWSEAWLRPALAAGIAAVVTFLAVSIPARRQTEALEARLASQATELRALSRAVEGAESTLRVLRSPAIDVVTLAGQGTQAGARGRIFWDRSRGVWHFYAADLKPAGAGRTYELWFIDSAQRKTPAGTFDVDAAGEGSIEVAVPADLGTIVLAAVTDEPAGGSPQPTGQIHLAGAVPTTS